MGNLTGFLLGDQQQALSDTEGFLQLLVLRRECVVGRGSLQRCLRRTPLPRSGGSTDLPPVGGMSLMEYFIQELFFCSRAGNTACVATRDCGLQRKGKQTCEMNQSLCHAASPYVCFYTAIQDMSQTFSDTDPWCGNLFSLFPFTKWRKTCVEGTILLSLRNGLWENRCGKREKMLSWRGDGWVFLFCVFIEGHIAYHEWKLGGDKMFYWPHLSADGPSL